MDKNAVFAVFAPAAGDKVSGMKPPGLPYLNFIGSPQNRHAVHARVFGQDPLIFSNLEILGVYRCGVISLRGGPRFYYLLELHQGGVA